MDTDELKYLVEHYLDARAKFNDAEKTAPDDDNLEHALDALYWADAIVRALKLLC